MNRYLIISIMAIMLGANPIYEVIVNEFQVAPTDSERIEFRYFRSASLDTIYPDSFPLLNTQLFTPAGQSFIDTQIYLPGMGYKVIDFSMLSGNFSLPDDTGFIKTRGGNFMALWDSIPYPQWAPTPPTHYSCAKFHFYYYDLGGYNLGWDWYLDSTPTFGADNDDYPGCLISGHIYDASGNPLENARVIATATYYATIINTPPYYKTCTTYTAVDGSYSIDSLLPWVYWVKASAPGYQTDSQLTGHVNWAHPCTNFNLYLGVGVEERIGSNRDEKLKVFPNPFHRKLLIVTTQPTTKLMLYDGAGRCILKKEKLLPTTHFEIDVNALPKGVYFIQTMNGRFKGIKL
ncbi:MAG: carboxypeptidase regulatory-like domain-containing protein [candidate division WOR-3 bacterium]